jgi:hypothetical protein|tara:strand:- start:894 stop:1154 length:261 start_codon:yes stop_codon:yes gene_type:complete
MIIEKNTICYTSEKGHNNFWYPSNNKLVIKENCAAEKISWLSGGNKIPIRLLKSCLLPIDITENTTTNISPPTKNDYTVVWIEKDV